MIKVCVRCDREYDTIQRSARYCSDRCRFAAWKEANPRVRQIKSRIYKIGRMWTWEVGQASGKCRTWEAARKKAAQVYKWLMAAKKSPAAISGAVGRSSEGTRQAYTGTLRRDR